MSATGGGVPVIICGDLHRSDDGVAIRAVAGLPAAVRALADVRQVGQLDVQTLLDAARPSVVVDAVVGVPAGVLVDLALGEVVRAGAPAPRSSHALPAAMAIGLAQALGADLRRSRLVGIGIADVRFGSQLSEPVARALPGLIELLSAAIREVAGTSAAPRPARRRDRPDRSAAA